MQESPVFPKNCPACKLGQHLNSSERPLMPNQLQWCANPATTPPIEGEPAGPALQNTVAAITQMQHCVCKKTRTQQTACWLTSGIVNT
jgi:hypothetical protein